MSFLSVRGVVKRYPDRRPAVTALDGISFELEAGGRLALVGESGAGKSTLARIIAGLLAPDAGAISIGGADPRGLERRERARRVQLVFQDASAALDPRMRVAAAIEEALAIQGLKRPERERKVESLLDAVGLDRALSSRYPHALSGGQRQRVALARALAPAPQLLLLDEALSGLDPESVEAITSLLAAERERSGLTSVLITHDLALAGALAGTIVVMQSGQVVEQGPKAAIFDDPRHPYTRRLLATVAGNG